MKNDTPPAFKARFLLTLKRGGWILYFVTTVSIFLEQFLSKWIEREFMSSEGAGNIVWFILAFYVALSLLTPIVTTFLVVTSISSSSVSQTLQKFWQLLVIENLRTAGKTILWSCLLVIPGFIRLIQFSFVQFIVLLDPNYDQGKVDALRRSTQLVNHRFIRVTAILGVFAFLLPLMIAGFDDYIRFDLNPLTALLFALLQTFVFILGTLALLNQWEKAHGTHVQLATS